jgi:hypothetical protein
MNRFKTIAGSGFALILTLAAPVAWGQTVPDNAGAFAARGAYQTNWSTQENVTLMDQNLSREIRQAWSEGKDATAAMAFQENAEIAFSEGKEQEANQYFSAAERELGSLKPVHTSY